MFPLPHPRAHCPDDELDILEAVIESNRQRHKTNEQIGREYETLKRVLHERESKQGKRNDLKSTSGNTLPEVKLNLAAAKSIGVSRPHADKAAAVVAAVDSLASSGAY